MLSLLILIIDLLGRFIDEIGKNNKNPKNAIEYSFKILLIN